MSNEAPPWPRIDSPLDDVNDDFHQAYDVARSAAEEAAPVLVFIDDTLVVFLRGKRRAIPVTPRIYHAIKSTTHAPLGLFSLLYPHGDKPLDAAVVRRLRALGRHIQVSLETLERDIVQADVREDMQTLLVSTVELIERTVADAATSHAALNAFARSCGPALQRLIDRATGFQLDALHACANEVIAAMTPAERGAMQVVIAGAHQARDRSLVMQYFRKRLHEPEHAEERVAYAENASDEQAALALVGTRRFDRAVAGAFFGDAKRLQRDVLGDAAAQQLSAVTFSPSAS